MTVLLWLAASVSYAADPVPDYQVKAALLVNIARLVDWPDDRFTSASAPFQLCLMGEHPFRDYLEKIAKKQQIQGRRIRLQVVSDPTRISGCHLLFVARSEDKRLEKILALTADQPVLTVSDTNGFAARGVLVNFYTYSRSDGDHIGFEVNVRAVDRSGLTIEATVLSNARPVGKAKRP